MDWSPCCSASRGEGWGGGSVAAEGRTGGCQHCAVQWAELAQSCQKVAKSSRKRDSAAPGKCKELGEGGGKHGAEGRLFFYQDLNPLKAESPQLPAGSFLVSWRAECSGQGQAPWFPSAGGGLVAGWERSSLEPSPCRTKAGAPLPALPTERMGEAQAALRAERAEFQAAVGQDSAVVLLLENPPQSSQGNHRADKEKMPSGFRELILPLQPRADEHGTFRSVSLEKQTLQPGSVALLQGLSPYES